MKLFAILLFCSCTTFKSGHFNGHEIIEDSIVIDGKVYHTYGCYSDDWRDTFPHRNLHYNLDK